MARNGVILKSPIIPTWKLVRFLASSTAPSSVTDTLARFTPAFKIAEDFCACATTTNNKKTRGAQNDFFKFHNSTVFK